MNEAQRYFAKRKPLRCPKCGSAKVVDILYGMPSPKAFEDASRGQVALGGCCITNRDPSWKCLECDGVMFREELR